MTYHECKAWVDENILRLMKELGVEHWQVTVSYERLEGGAVADIIPRSDYETAYMRIDYDNVATEYVERYVIHELMHCVCSPYRHFVEVALEACKSTVEVEMLRELFRHTDERVVKTLERMRKAILVAHTGAELVIEVKDLPDPNAEPVKGNDHEDDLA